MLEALVATRVVANPQALDSSLASAGAVVFRLAPDEVLVVGGTIEVDDPHALIVADHGWVAYTGAETALRRSLSHHCSWEPVAGLNQGTVAGIPAKVWLAGEESMILVAAAYASEFEERFT